MKNELIWNWLNRRQLGQRGSLGIPSVFRMWAASLLFVVKTWHASEIAYRPFHKWASGQCHFQRLCIRLPLCLLFKVNRARAMPWISHVGLWFCKHYRAVCGAVSINAVLLLACFLQSCWWNFFFFAIFTVSLHAIGSSLALFLVLTNLQGIVGVSCDARNLEARSGTYIDRTSTRLLLSFLSFFF